MFRNCSKEISRVPSAADTLERDGRSGGTFQALGGVKQTINNAFSGCRTLRCDPHPDFHDSIDRQLRPANDHLRSLLRTVFLAVA